ncbi:MAG: hypothetical protein C0490_26875, partial [Marivirga sp.]|nr:hypothetical protein [Marivirga sp.]
MIELYARREARLGKRKADLLFIWNVLLFIQPFVIRKKSNLTLLNPFAMFQNYLKIAWRTMGHQKLYTSIKVGGFALGLATCMTIFLFIRHETSYDQQYKNGEQIFRVYNDFTKDDQAKWSSFPASMAPILKSTFPEVEKAGRLIPYNWFNAGNNLFRREDQL